MANRNIDESIRKPRRAKGTPFFLQRNYYASGIIIFGGLAWLLFELWPETKKLKKSQLEGKFDNSPELKEEILRRQLSITKYGYESLFTNLIRRQQEKEDAFYEEDESTKPQRWFTKLFFSQPDI